MSTDVRLPFGEFLLGCIREYRKENPQGISDKTWVECFDRWQKAWTDARKAARAKRTAAFVPPTPEEVTAYSISIGWPLDGVSWCLGYATKGWCTSGTAKMKNWQLAVQKWKREGIKTKITPEGKAETQKGPSEPPDWLEWMRVNCPQWAGFERGTITWDRLIPQEKQTILELIAKE